MIQIRKIGQEQYFCLSSKDYEFTFTYITTESKLDLKNLVLSEVRDYNSMKVNVSLYKPEMDELREKMLEYIKDNNYL